MSALAELAAAYAGAAENQQQAQGAPAWLESRRQAALATFRTRGMPNQLRREERWRFLNLQSLLARMYEPNAPVTVELTGPDAISAQVYNIAETPPTVEPWLAAIATDYDDNPFTALNTAACQQITVVHIPATVQADEPVYVTISTEADGDRMACPRLLVVAEAGTRATVIERYAGRAAVTNTVTEVHIGQDAQLHHIRIQDDHADAVHLSTTAVRHHGNNSTLNGLSINLGARLARNDINVQLDGEQLESTINGMYLLVNDQVIDNHTRIEHLQPNSISHELFKGVLGNRSRAVFNGRIYVDQKAQKTDAFQSNPNLLLSDDAVANSNPELEIYADDVRCSHGATYGDLEQDALFYLRTRGFSRDQAEEILVNAFLGELLETIDIDQLRAEMQQRIADRMQIALSGALTSR